MVQGLDRLLLACSVASDHAARVLLASAIPAAMAPHGLLVDGATERRRLEYYAAVAGSHNPRAIFTPPPRPIPVHSERLSGPGDDGRVIERLRFHSPYEPLHPELRDIFRPTSANALACAQYWRHVEGPRPTLLVIHGMGASGPGVNAELFGVKGFFRDGWDIVLYTLPFHGARRGPRSPFDGAGLFSGGLSRFHEAMVQAICELRVLLDHLTRRGARRIGATGVSLGGYTTALLAAVDDRLDFAIPNSTVADIGALIEGWWTVRRGTRLLEHLKGIPPELVLRSLALHSPLNYPRALPVSRLLLIAGTKDRVSPPAQSLALWRHWDQPALHWFPGGHVIHRDRDRYRRRMSEVMGHAAATPAGPAPLPRPLRST